MKLSIGDIVEWAFSDATSFVGIITSIDKKEIKVAWFSNNGQNTTYDIYILQHLKRLS